MCIIQAAWINDGPFIQAACGPGLSELKWRVESPPIDWCNVTILTFILSCLSSPLLYPPPPPTPTHSTEKCDEALASPLPHTAFTSSSVFSNGYAPGYAKLNRRGGEVHRKASWLRIDPDPPNPKTTFRDGSVGWLRKMWTACLEKVWVVEKTQRECC